MRAGRTAIDGAASGLRPRVGVVIVAYNSPSRLERCLESVAGNGYGEVEIFVIDNSTIYHSPPASPKGVRLTHRRTGDNVGFCAGCNLGIAMALESGVEYVLLLNYDTVLEPGAIAALVARARSLPNPGIIGPKIRYLQHPGILWYGGGRLSLALGVGKHLGFNEKDEGQRDAGGPVSYVTGCCMLVPARVFAEVGPLKAELFMYLDDAELCLQMRARGLALYYEPSAVILHETGPGLRRSGYPDYYLYFSIRNRPHITRNPAYRAYLGGVALALAAAKLAVYGLSPGVAGRAGKVRAILMGWIDSFSLAPRYRRRFPRLFAADRTAAGTREKVPGEAPRDASGQGGTPGPQG